MHGDAQVDDTKRKRVDTKAWAEKFVLLKKICAGLTQLRLQFDTISINKLQNNK